MAPSFIRTLPLPPALVKAVVLRMLLLAHLLRIKTCTAIASVCLCLVLLLRCLSTHVPYRHVGSRLP